jgi:hypothetical protein
MKNNNLNVHIMCNRILHLRVRFNEIKMFKIQIRTYTLIQGRTQGNIQERLWNVHNYLTLCA